MKYFWRTISVFVPAMLLLLNINGCTKSPEDKTVNELIGTIQTSNQSLRSGSGSYTFRYKLHDIAGGMKETANIDSDMYSDMELVTNYREHYTYSFQGDKFAYEEIQNPKPHYTLKQKVTYNGKIYKRLVDHIRENSQNLSQGFVSKNYPGDRAKNNPLFYITDYLEMFLNGYAHGSYSLTGIAHDTYDSHPCRTVQFSSGKSHDNVITFWLAGDLSYRVVKITKTRHKTEKPVEETTISYRRVDGVNFPGYIKHVNYMSDGNSKIKTTELLFEDDWKLNYDLPEETFDLTFPDGIEIFGGKDL